MTVGRSVQEILEVSDSVNISVHVLHWFCFGKGEGHAAAGSLAVLSDPHLSCCLVKACRFGTPCFTQEDRLYFVYSTL